MGLWRATNTAPEPVDEPAMADSVGAKAIRAAVESFDAAVELESVIIGAISRINRGLHDHFHHPQLPRGVSTVDALLDMTNNLHKALDETRQRLEDGLRKLDERRGGS